MMKWYSVKSTVAKSINVEMIRHGFSPPGERSNTDSFDKTNTEITTRIMDAVLLSMNGKS